MRTATILAFVISLLVQVSFPLAVTLYYRRRTRAPWQLFAYGAAVFAVFQLFTWLPLSAYLDVIVGPALDSELRAFIWLLALAMSTSLVEEAGRWLGYRFLFPQGAFALTWRNGVMYGLGHAALETMLLIAGLTFVHFLAYVALGRLEPAVLPRSLDPDASLALSQALREIMDTSWWQPLTVAIERVLAVPHQVAWALLVMESLVYRRKRWFVFAVVYHASIAVIIPGVARLAGFALAEGVNLLFALLSLWIILRLRGLSGEEV